MKTITKGQTMSEIKLNLTWTKSSDGSYEHLQNIQWVDFSILLSNKVLFEKDNYIGAFASVDEAKSFVETMLTEMVEDSLKTIDAKIVLFTDNELDFIRKHISRNCNIGIADSLPASILDKINNALKVQ